MTDTPRIFMTADAVGGVWTYAVGLARGLASFDVPVTLAVIGPDPDPRQRAQVAGIKDLHLIPTGLPLEWTATDPSAVRRTGDAVAELARKSDAVVIHLNSPILAGDTEFDRPVLGMCHSCLSTWWSAVRTDPLPDHLAWQGEELRRGFGRCALLIAPTRAFAEQTARCHGIAPPRVVHNGRRPDKSKAVKDAGFVLAAGRLWDQGKNVQVLDRAAAQIPAPVYAAGDRSGPDGNEIALTHARALGRLDATALGEWMQRAPVFASAARYEPFGLAVLEAAQAGCALVLSDIPTHRELWDGAAVFADPDDPDAFASGMRHLLGNSEARTDLAARAQERAGQYNLDSMTINVLAAYRAAAAAPASGAA
jgi:glycosyltransferase involved in cell wall biosynthesis